jgi:hypothetical protein
MEIAVIGWGSLIWCPGSLRIKTKWRSDGPKLPLEFARISQDGRLTLVILLGAKKQQTYWALSEFDNVSAARQNLREREGWCALKNIHSLPAKNRDADDIPPMVRKLVSDWLTTRKELEAVIWTGLTTNWSEKRGGQKFTCKDAIRYLKQLESERDRAKSIYDRAREYVKNTPPLIQTKVRRAMQHKGWQDTELSKVLFED